MRRLHLCASPTACAATALLLLMPVPATTQDVTGPALKAAFIYNFAKFTVWPAEAMRAAEPLTLCVISDAAIADALERAVRDRTLAGHSIFVLQSGPGGPPRGECHLVYVSGMTETQTATLVAGLGDAPVLTISDLDGFTRLGGIAQFFFQNGRLRFTVHLESARRARLQISSRLLALAVVQ